MNIKATVFSHQSMTVSNDYETAIIKTLLKLGIPANTKGFHYIKAALLYSVDYPIALTSMSKTVYPAIAELYYSTSAESVERAIRYAIAQSALRGDSEFICRIFGYTENIKNYNPTNREFLAVVSEYIRQLQCPQIPQLQSVSA